MDHMEIQVPKERVNILLEKLKAKGLLDTPEKEIPEGAANHSATSLDLSKLREMASWLEQAVSVEGDTIRLNVGEITRHITALRDGLAGQRKKALEVKTQASLNNNSDSS